MSSLVFIACTPVARCMIEALYGDERFAGIDVSVVNLNARRALTKANYDDYYDLVEKYGFPIHYCDNINDPETLDWIRDKKPDLIIQSGWSQKFKDELLAIPKYGCIGEHPAPLPRGRGAACVNWAILTGETDWGDSFFRMVSEYDKGEIFAQSFFTITPEDDVKTVYDKVGNSSRLILQAHVLDWLQGRFDIIENDDSKATYYKRRRPTDGVFAFADMDAKPLYDFIRAQARPYPGAYFMHEGKKVIVWRAALPGVQTDADVQPLPNGALRVRCKDGFAVDLLRVQGENLPEMWGSDWYAG